MYNISAGNLGDGVGFVGLGLPTISGLTMSEINKDFCGFEFKKTDAGLDVIAIQCDSGDTPAFSGVLESLVDNDVLELFIKKNGTTSIDYYTRKNGGALSAKTPLSTHLPTGGENLISFMFSNKGAAVNTQIEFRCAAYEH